MRVTRRNLIKILAVTIGGAAIGFTILKWQKKVIKRWLMPNLKDGPTDTLEDGILQILLTATETIADVPIDTLHYENLFRWRSENLRGYNNLYNKFARALNSSAKRLTGKDFIGADRETQLRILDKTYQIRMSTGKLNLVRYGIFERDWILFDRYIIRDILRLFIRTDAWIMLGYESWPGKVRGLRRYRVAPGKIKLKSNSLGRQRRSYYV